MHVYMHIYCSRKRFQFTLSNLYKEGQLTDNNPFHSILQCSANKRSILPAALQPEGTEGRLHRLGTLRTPNPCAIQKHTLRCIVYKQSQYAAPIPPFDGDSEESESDRCAWDSWSALRRPAPARYGPTPSIRW